MNARFGTAAACLILPLLAAAVSVSRDSSSPGWNSSRLSPPSTEARNAAQADRPYLAAAEKAARWIMDSAIRTESGLAWPADPRDPASVDMTLYSGVPGIVLFLTELARTTGKPEYLEAAKAGADEILARLPGIKGAGLYEGLAGAGFALREAFKAGKESRHEEGFRRALEMIRSASRQTGKGVEWSSTTDIISGGAGTGLFLLYAHRETGERSWLDLAEKAGRRLLEMGRLERGGLKWPMDPEYPSLMPNFSHGTAGIAYFLAVLHKETGREEFLDGALAGGRYLQAVAGTEDDGCLVFHHEPGGEKLFYLGWCHGPVGTARLFYTLAQVADDPGWMEWVRKAARSLRSSGLLEKETPGFWNNAGVCCGLAGVAEFFIDLSGATGNQDDLDFARRAMTRLIARGTGEEGRAFWVQAEHRTRPDFLVAQTGLMQGAAGIGLIFLKMDALDRGASLSIILPDTPFTR